MGLNRSKNLSSAKDTCDTWFSKYVRLRDANHNELCKCVTCNTIKHWKEMDCGHFQSRRFSATRYHEQNAHAQCQSCNKYNAGEQYRHGIEIDLLYGEGTADYLEQLSRSMIKLNKVEVMELAQYYKQEAEKIAKEKAIQL
jgi:hypothetical protein